MAELRNCPTCNTFFNYTGIRDVCHKCAQSEEEKYQTVYKFLRKRENRAATVERIEEATGVEKELLYKFVRKGRLHPATFPNLGYPCDHCGKLTKEGKICESCQKQIKTDLNRYDAAVEFRDSIKDIGKSTYHADKNRGL